MIEELGDTQGNFGELGGTIGRALPYLLVLFAFALHIYCIDYQSIRQDV